MKRILNEVKDKEVIEAILQSGTVGRIATVDNSGYPYIVPVNYTYHNGKIYFHCAKQGEKLDNITRNSKVGFEMDVPLAYLDSGYFRNGDIGGVTQFYHSVIIRGTASLVEELEEKVEALNALMRSHEEKSKKVTRDMKCVAACSVVGIVVEEMTCKANYAQAKKEEEREKIARYLKQRNEPGDREAAAFILNGYSK